MNIFTYTIRLFVLLCMMGGQILAPVFVSAQSTTPTEPTEVPIRAMCQKDDITHFIDTWQHLDPFSSGTKEFLAAIASPGMGNLTTANSALVTSFLSNKDFFEHILITFPSERRLKRAYREGLHAGQNAANPSVVSPSKIDIYKEDRCTNFIMSYLPKTVAKYKDYKNSVGTKIYPEVLLYYFRKGFYESFEGTNNKALGGGISGFQMHSFSDVYDPELTLRIDFANIKDDSLRIGMSKPTSYTPPGGAATNVYEIYDILRGTLTVQFITYEYRPYGNYFIEIPRILPPIEIRIDDEGDESFTSLLNLDDVLIYRSDTALDEIKLLQDNPNMIVRILEGSVEFRSVSDQQIVTAVPTIAAPYGTPPLEINRMEIYATDKKSDRIIVDPFREQLVADGEVYDGRGGGVKAVAKGKFRGLVETDSSDELFKGIINFFLSFVGAIAVLMLVYAGFMFMTDGGDSSQSKKAITTVQNTVVGIILIIASYTIVNTVLDFNGNARDQVRVEIKMGSSTLLGATLARGGCMYTGATAGVVRLCNENGLLILKVQSLNINTFWPLEEVRGVCRKASIFTICIEDEY